MGESVATVLIVEDEAVSRMALSVYLQDIGLNILEASNADEAVIAIASASLPIDLVFSDIGLPGAMNGFALARWIRAERPQLPVILTSDAAMQTKIAEQHCEKEIFVPKPYDPRQLATLIMSALDTRQPEEVHDDSNPWMDEQSSVRRPALVPVEF